MTFKDLALIVERIWHVYYILYCKNTWSAKATFLRRFVLDGRTDRRNGDSIYAL